MSATLTDEYLKLLKLALTGLTEASPMRLKVGPRPQDRTLANMRIFPAEIEDRLEGRDWPAFALTMVGMKRLDNVQECVERVIADEVPGDLIETGVWRGGVCMLMRAVLKAHGVSDRIVFAADSFEGLPMPAPEEFPVDEGCRLYQWDFLTASLEDVKATFERYGLLDDQVRFVQGWFRDTMPMLAGHQWSVIRLDGDMYESTMVVLENLYPGLSDGGYLIVDDYNIKRCREAIDDYRRAYGVEDEIHEIDANGVYWRKEPTDG